MAKGGQCQWHDETICIILSTSPLPPLPRMERLALHLVLALLLVIQPVAVVNICTRTGAASTSAACCCATLSCDRGDSRCGCLAETPEAPRSEPKRVQPPRSEMAVIQVPLRLVASGKLHGAAMGEAREAPNASPRRAVLCVWMI